MEEREGKRRVTDNEGWNKSTDQDNEKGSVRPTSRKWGMSALLFHARFFLSLIFDAPLLLKKLLKESLSCFLAMATATNQE